MTVPVAVLLAILALLAVAATVWRECAWRRRRVAANRALHELRRPLQALTLAAGPNDRERGPTSLELAVAALDRLDRTINRPGRPAVRRQRGRRRPRPIPRRPPPAAECIELLRAACRRWTIPARALGGSIELAPATDDCGRRLALSQTLDNLILNGLTHGTGRIVLAAERRADRFRIEVRDVPPSPRPRRSDPRHGHGLAIARDTAGSLGGRLELRFGPDGGRAAIELPADGMSAPRR